MARQMDLRQEPLRARAEAPCQVVPPKPAYLAPTAKYQSRSARSAFWVADGTSVNVCAECCTNESTHLAFLDPIASSARLRSSSDVLRLSVVSLTGAGLAGLGTKYQ